MPDPDFSDEEGYVTPSTETERVICRIWEEVLGLERVGVRDNFFRIGGDSILSIQVSGRVRQAGYDCQVKDIFECKTVSRLSEHLSNKGAGIIIKSEQGLLTGESGLLPVQQWFIEKVKGGALKEPNHWNQSFLVRVPELDLDRLGVVIEELVFYHDVLRMRYTREDSSAEPTGSGWKQEYQSGIVVPELKTLDVSKYSAGAIQDILTGWQSGFDLEQGRLFQGGYLHGYADGSARVYFAMHHMIVDGVSWRILAEDIKALYAGKKLPVKGSSYRQWVESVRHYADEHASEAAYWQEQLEGMRGYEGTEPQEGQWSQGFVELDETLTDSLLHKASKAYHTDINDLLLTAVGYAFKDINQNDVQGITLEGHGREDIDARIDHSRTVGWFTSMFPVKLELKDSVKASIQSIKEGLRKIPKKGIGFGAFATSKTTGYTHQDLPRVSFNYLGQFDSQQGDWEIVVTEGSGISMGAGNRDDNVININGAVSNGRLSFSIVTRLGEDITRQLSNSFKRGLTAIIEHCEEKLEQEGSSHTPSDFNLVRISQPLLDRLETGAKATQNELVHIYPATSLQQGFIYHALSQNQDDAYRVQLVYDYPETLDIEKYIQAWEYCIAQYPILRTAFNWEEDIIQIIYRRGKLEYEVHDISGLSGKAQRDAAIEAIQVADRQRGFDLTRPTLVRLHIIKQAGAYYTIIKSEHHSISDGWSGPVLLTSLHQYYESLREHREVSIKEDRAYLEAQDYINSHKDAIEDYWNRSLSAVNGANDINALLSEPIELSSYKQVEQPQSSILEIGGDVYKELKAFIQRQEITINVLVQFIWHKLLQVYSSSMQSIVGTTVSGRDLPVAGIESSVGLYINTLPLLINWDNDNTIAVQLQQIHQQIRELNTHSFADLAKLQRDGQRLFHSLLVFENYPMPKGEKGAEGVSKMSIRDVIEKVDYPLSIIAYEHSDSLAIMLGYDGRYLTKEKANRHLATLQGIIEEVIAGPGKLHREMSLVGSEEYNRIVYGWNETGREYPEDQTVYELFQEQAARTPDGTALVYEGEELSYRELNERSNQLARHIRKAYKAKTGHTLVADTLIGLYLERSLEMVIGILGVLKAGGAYVPMDPGYPQERIDYILRIRGPRWCLVKEV